MIEIVRSGPCEDCEHIELYLDQIEISDLNKQRHIHYEVHCVHEDICDMWEEKVDRDPESN